MPFSLDETLLWRKAGSPACAFDKEEGRTSEGTVLVVDDEGDVRKSVRLILSKAGYDVVEAEDGEAGVKAIKCGYNPFTLGAIICDLNMPKMSGMEAITYFRSHFPHASVIVLSGEVTTERAGVLLVQGVSSILSKPINQDTLLAATKKAFDVGRLKRPIHECRGFHPSGGHRPGAAEFNADAFKAAGFLLELKHQEFRLSMDSAAFFPERNISYVVTAISETHW